MNARSDAVRALFIAAALLIPSVAWADPCDMVPNIGSRSGVVVDASAATVLIVTRFHRHQGDRTDPGPSGHWVDDVPSDTLGAAAICDRVQLETPVPMDGAERLRMTMQQGERLHPSALASDYVARLTIAGRVVHVPARTYYAAFIEDPDQPGWRRDLLRDAAGQGEIDTSGWMIGLPGALYLVPITP